MAELHKAPVGTNVTDPFRNSHEVERLRGLLRDVKVEIRNLAVCGLSCFCGCKAPSPRDGRGMTTDEIPGLAREKREKMEAQECPTSPPRLPSA